MVPGCKPVISLVNVPVPVPSLVLLSAVVGLAVVDQHTPLAVTGDPPSDVTFPPEVAVVAVTFVTAVVVTVAPIASVVKVTSFPYAVPASFVAYALT